MSEEVNLNKSEFTKLEPNLAAALSYIFAPFSGLLFYFWEKEDEFVKFHAMQAIVFGTAAMVVWQLVSIIPIFFIWQILRTLVSAGSFILYIFVMLKAFNGEKYEIPIVSDYAKKLLK